MPVVSLAPGFPSWRAHVPTISSDKAALVKRSLVHVDDAVMTVFI